MLQFCIFEIYKGAIMKVLVPKYIITCDDDFKILQDYAIIFDKHIQKIIPLKELSISPNDELISVPNYVAMPALINAHTHLEFCTNRARLKYGDFVPWLSSVIGQKEILLKKLNRGAVRRALKSMLESGVGTVGEISSFGEDLDVLAKSEARTVFFAEILGPKQEDIEKNWSSFLARYKEAKTCASELFKPAISVHSPYSTHPELLERATRLAKSENVLMSTHFLESKAEKVWLEDASGDFKKWLSSFSHEPKPYYTPKSFLAAFDKDKTLFAHCLYAKEYFEDIKHIAHCPRSNRLLDGFTLDIKNASKYANIALGTDGMSSNYSLNIWDEMRAALFTHRSDINNLTKDLFMMATRGGAKALHLNNGIIKEGAPADIAVAILPKGSDGKQLPLDIILHSSLVSHLFVNGQSVNLHKEPKE